jgi:glutamate N-acetyltransferase / amino-acid N-acetyltransferase
MSEFQIMDRFGVTWPKGFRAQGIKCGIKASGKPDLAVLLSDEASLTFGSFTQNQVAAAPVGLSQRVLNDNSYLRGVVINSGNANACTGATGLQNAQEMVDLSEVKFNLPSHSLLLCQTGIIGVPLPMDCIQSGIPKLEEALRSKSDGESADGAFAEAILTTDTCQKQIAISIPSESGEIRIGGAAKGSGMIHPNMATMLAFVTTDLELPDSFRKEFQTIVDDSFNSITVDGDTSTNDTCIMMSSGCSGISYDELTMTEQSAFRQALFFVFADLAQKIVKDGEGATKFVKLKVTGARGRAEARDIARYVANSKLVKTALFGNDANWGRLIAAVGNAGIPVSPEKISIHYNDSCVLFQGEPALTAQQVLDDIAKSDAFTISIDLDLGHAQAAIWTSDLSYEYVRINAEYTT